MRRRLRCQRGVGHLDAQDAAVEGHDLRAPGDVRRRPRRATPRAAARGVCSGRAPKRRAAKSGSRASVHGASLLLRYTRVSGLVVHRPGASRHELPALQDARRAALGPGRHRHLPRVRVAAHDPLGGPALAGGPEAGRDRAVPPPAGARAGARRSPRSAPAAGRCPSATPAAHARPSAGADGRAGRGDGTPRGAGRPRGRGRGRGPADARRASCARCGRCARRRTSSWRRSRACDGRRWLPAGAAAAAGVADADRRGGRRRPLADPGPAAQDGRARGRRPGDARGGGRGAPAGRRAGARVRRRQRGALRHRGGEAGRDRPRARPRRRRWAARTSST